MTPRQQEVERAMLRYFTTIATSGRADILQEIDIDYPRFMAAIRMAWENEQNLPSEELLHKRLRQVRVHVKAPRLGKTGKLFTLRHWPESRRLREQGASYREIQEYLQTFRKFKISVAYLKRLMEELAE